MKYKPKEYVRKSGIWHYMGYDKINKIFYVLVEKPKTITWATCSNTKFQAHGVISFKKRTEVYSIFNGKIYTPKDRFSKLDMFLQKAITVTGLGKKAPMVHRGKKARVIKIIRRVARRNHRDINFKYELRKKHSKYQGTDEYLTYLVYKKLLKNIPKTKWSLFISNYVTYNMRFLPKESINKFALMEDTKYELQDFICEKYKLKYKLELSTPLWYIEKRIQRKLVDGILPRQYESFMMAIQRFHHIFGIGKSLSEQIKYLPKVITKECVLWAPKGLKKPEDFKQWTFNQQMKGILDEEAA
jgi:hypothetical protein